MPVADSRLRITDVGKPQAARAVDVFLIGPLLVWAGMQEEPLPKWVRDILITVGVVTVIYNAKNYLAVRSLSAETFKRQGPQIYKTGDL